MLILEKFVSDNAIDWMIVTDEEIEMGITQAMMMKLSVKQKNHCLNLTKKAMKY